MKRKAFILLILIAIISFSTVCFANMGNDIKNAVNGTTNTVVDGAENLSGDVRSGIQDAENTVENGVRNFGTAITDSANDLMGTTNNTTNDTANNTNNANNSSNYNNNGNYTASRTATDTSITGTDVMTSSMWTWIILAIAAAVIVGLVWYYAKQHNNIH